MYCPVAGYPNYIISNDGVVISHKLNKPLKHGIDKDGYHLVSLNGKSFRLHRLVCKHFGNWDETLTVDHIDRNKDNNHIDNLRLATHLQQKFNTKHKDGKYPTGVHKHRNKYASQIRIDGIKKHLGMFDTPEEASEAYQSKAREIHGEFFRT